MEWLNYHHLLYFWTVAREGGLAPAGKALRLSQSAISGQIRRLEENFGLPLFAKRGRKLEMTDSGRVVYRYAEKIFGLGRELLDVIRERPGDRALRLVVGISDVVPKLLVRKVLAPAFEVAERLELVCHEQPFERLLDGLVAHVMDVVIADSPVPPDREQQLFSHCLGESSLTLVAPRSLAASLRRDFPRCLAGKPLLMPLGGSSMRRDLDGWFQRNAIVPDIIAEAEDSALLTAFAVDGMGAMFVPTVIAGVVTKRYQLAKIAEIHDVQQRFYAITAERRIVHPSLIAIRAAAQAEVFR